MAFSKTVRSVDGSERTKCFSSLLVISPFAFIRCLSTLLCLCTAGTFLTRKSIRSSTFNPRILEPAHVTITCNNFTNREEDLKRRQDGQLATSRLRAHEDACHRIHDRPCLELLDRGQQRQRRRHNHAEQNPANFESLLLYGLSFQHPTYSRSRDLPPSQEPRECLLQPF